MGHTHGERGCEDEEHDHCAGYQYKSSPERAEGVSACLCPQVHLWELILTQYGNRDALTRIESQIQENHAVLVSHVRASEAGFTGIQQQVGSGVKTLEARLDDHNAQLFDHRALSGEMMNIPKIGVQKEEAQHLLNISSKGYRESLSIVMGHIDGETDLLNKTPTLSSRIVKPASDVVCSQDNIAQSAVNQAQCILQIKDELMNMHQTLRTNSTRLDAIETIPVASNSASRYLTVDLNNINTLLAGLRVTTQELYKRCGASISKVMGTHPHRYDSVCTPLSRFYVLSWRRFCKYK